MSVLKSVDGTILELALKWNVVKESQKPGKSYGGLTLSVVDYLLIRLLSQSQTVAKPKPEKAKYLPRSLDEVKTTVCVSIMCHCRFSCYSGFSCSLGVDIDRVVRDAKRVFCNTPRTASMRRHDRLFADPSVKHVSQNHRLLFHQEKFVMCQARV